MSRFHVGRPPVCLLTQLLLVTTICNPNLSRRVLLLDIDGQPRLTNPIAPTTSPLNIAYSKRVALASLNVRLDDSLFQRLVESRWDADKGSDGKGLDMSGFLRLYGIIFAPAITFGRHLRRAAGRGDEEIGENGSTDRREMRAGAWRLWTHPLVVSVGVGGHNVEYHDVGELLADMMRRRASGGSARCVAVAMLRFSLSRPCGNIWTAAGRSEKRFPGSKLAYELVPWLVRAPNTYRCSQGRDNCAAFCCECLQK